MAISVAVARAEDWMARRAGPTAIIAVSTPTIIASVVVAAATFIVAMLVTDIAPGSLTRENHALEPSQHLEENVLALLKDYNKKATSLLV